MPCFPTYWFRMPLIPWCSSSAYWENVFLAVLQWSTFATDFPSHQFSFINGWSSGTSINSSSLAFLKIPKPLMLPSSRALQSQIPTPLLACRLFGDSPATFYSHIKIPPCLAQKPPPPLGWPHWYLTPMWSTLLICQLLFYRLFCKMFLLIFSGNT